MRAIWKGFISFGLVTIPVGVGLAQQRKDVSFRTLSRESMTPVKQKRWDPVRDVEVGPEDVVKGYEFAKGRFVTVEDDELERFAARQEKTIDILEFVDLADVDPIFFDKAYWIEPQERAERPYALLLQAMQRSGKAAIGRFVLSTKSHLVLLRPSPSGALMLQTLYYADDLRASEGREIGERVSSIEVRDEELAIADQLIASLSKEFESERHPNTSREQLIDYLQAKAGGEEPIIVEESAEPAPVVDLMAALKASLAAAGVAGDEAAPAKKPRAARAKKADDGDAADEPTLRVVDDEAAAPKRARKAS